MELKGSKTEANLQAAFAGESQARNNTMRRKQKKTAMYRLPIFLRKQRRMKRNMQRSGLSCFTAAPYLRPLRI